MVDKPECSTGKKPILTADKAITVSLKMSKKFGGAFRFYQCPNCQYWHTTKLSHAFRNLDWK